MVTQRERHDETEKEKRNKEKGRRTEGRREGGNYFTVLLSERCSSWTLQGTITFEVKTLNLQMEDLALSFTINSLWSHVLLLPEKREAKSLLCFKDNGIEIWPEKEAKKVTILSYPLKKINFPKTNTRNIKDQNFNLSGHLNVTSGQKKFAIYSFQWT